MVGDSECWYKTEWNSLWCVWPPDLQWFCSTPETGTELYNSVFRVILKVISVNHVVVPECFIHITSAFLQSDYNYMSWGRRGGGGGGGGLCWCDTCSQVSDRCFLPVSTEQPSTFWSCANKTVLSCCLIQVFWAKTWSLTKPNQVFCALTSSPEQKHRMYRSLKFTRVLSEPMGWCQMRIITSFSLQGTVHPDVTKTNPLPGCCISYHLKLFSCELPSFGDIERRARIWNLPAYVQVFTCHIDVCTKHLWSYWMLLQRPPDVSSRICVDKTRMFCPGRSWWLT